MNDRLILKAGTGIALALPAHACVAVTNIHGQQVVDTWALCASDTSEVLSMEHTRSSLDKLRPRVGDDLFTNRRRPVLNLAEDTSPGVHDTLLSACDEARYRLLGFKGTHASCSDNFFAALREIGIAVPRIPSPWNLFENVQIGDDGTLKIQPPVSSPGDHVVIRSLVDVIMVFSACPMDIALTNGLDRQPKDIALYVTRPR
jgi:uncharacterized protein YcgI (DUF1989 family)